ncbi:MAG: hypothetical protein D6775_04035 [Caldilineae bacterium]|nr:MAG: hypothetical protein D6775_04035 [Caldilineae bacterium]
MLLALLLLLAGIWAGLLRIGWRWPALHPTMAASHGPLMIGGFLGTLIALERVVALARLQLVRRPAVLYLGPVATAVGGLLLLVGRGSVASVVLVALGSAVLVVMMLVLYMLHPASHSLIMAAGAVAWLLGNLLWLGGRPVAEATTWWGAFLVLTIGGERLELSQVLRLDRRTRGLFLGATGCYLLGTVLAFWQYDVGVRVAGLGMLAFGLWLLAYDVAGRRLHSEGQVRFTAWALFLGYAWLAVAGVLALVWGGVSAGPGYDAWLHALLLGFVFSMIFAHAPIVFPAVLSRPLPFSPRFYSHLAVLHLALVLRIIGDVGNMPVLRRWGGLLNAAALLLFLLNTMVSVHRGNRQKEAAVL